MGSDGVVGQSYRIRLIVGIGFVGLSLKVYSI